MTKRNLIYTIIMLYLFISYAVVFLFEPPRVILLTNEDGFFETIGALFFLFASIIFFITFLKDKRGNNFHFFKTNRNIFFLLLTFLFFLAFGEEISWGQRIFHLHTPEILNEINTQKEINIHNLTIFQAETGSGVWIWGRKLSLDLLFSAFWFTYCFVIPIVNRMSKPIHKGLKTINLPILPIGIAVIFILNYLLSKIAELYGLPPVREPVVEIKESNLAFLFLIVSIWFLTRDNKIGKKVNFLKDV